MYVARNFTFYQRLPALSTDVPHADLTPFPGVCWLFAAGLLSRVRPHVGEALLLALVALAAGRGAQNEAEVAASPFSATRFHCCTAGDDGIAGDAGWLLVPPPLLPPSLDCWPSVGKCAVCCCTSNESRLVGSLSNACSYASDANDE